MDRLETVALSAGEPRRRELVRVCGAHGQALKHMRIRHTVQAAMRER